MLRVLDFIYFGLHGWGFWSLGFRRLGTGFAWDLKFSSNVAKTQEGM